MSSIFLRRNGSGRSKESERRSKEFGELADAGPLLWRLGGWRKAHQFVLALYAFTATFPKQEMYGLAAQMRRAAVSIPANTAEGFVKRSRPDKARYRNVAEGSLEESRYLILARDLGYGSTDKLLATLEEVSRLLSSYARSLLAPRS